MTNRTKTPKRCAAVARVVGLYSEAQVSCGPSSLSSALVFLSTADAHRRPSLPREPGVAGAANAASTWQNLFLSRTNPPLSNASNPPAVCYHSNRYPVVIPVLAGRRVERETGRHRYVARHREPRILIIVENMRRALPGSCRIGGWS